MKDPTKLIFFLTLVLFLTACAGWKIMVKAQCSIDSHFNVDKCYTYPRISRDKQ